MKIVTLTLLVSLVGLIQASNLISYAPIISDAQCTKDKKCSIPYGQDVVCRYDRHQQIHSLKTYVQEETLNKLSTEEENKLVNVLAHFSQFKLRLKDSSQVLKEISLEKPFESKQTEAPIDAENPSDWFIQKDSDQLNSSRAYACCLEVTVEEKYLEYLKNSDGRFFRTCTRIKLEVPKSWQNENGYNRDWEKVPVPLPNYNDDDDEKENVNQKSSSSFKDFMEFVRNDKARHSEYFVPLVLATVAMVILVALSTAFCIVTIIFEVVCSPRGGKRHRQKPSRQHLRIVNEDSFQFDHPDYETATTAINLPCTITEYLRQIESSPTSSTINIRQQQEIAPPSYTDSMKTVVENEYAFNMAMKF